ncbi:hypothetical protein MLD38_009306 [Melastoma candidum]|uniref:Uncharacterized protein n=1 Tax=Melastoma candidum TaxID=119954 RepID=A0ACB9RWU2_9MYRT|nr:hypothetical protein MLD38_009306 [Melastoma candidum]
MQRRAAHLEAELWKLKERLIEVERERDQALDDLDESRRQVDEANAKLSAGFTPRKVPEIYTEVTTLKKLLTNTSRELKDKEKEIEVMRVEIKRGKEVKARLAETEIAVGRLRKELENMMVAEERVKSDHEQRVRELEDDLERRKQSELRTYESLATLTKQLEKTKMALEELKLEMSMERTNSNKDSTEKNHSKENRPGKDVSESSVLESTEQKLTRVNDEVRKLKVELRLSNAAEENSKKALDDLVIALKEVATESNQVKLKLDITQTELDHSQREETNLKMRLQVADEMSKKLIDELRTENELSKSTVEKLRKEVEESFAAWTEKEAGFIACIRTAEEDKAFALNESMLLGESLKAADKMVKSSREENNKLRDILKQALNEASVAKEAASIARAENSQLKDELSEKDDALQFLTRENESLRMNEATTAENIRELKRLASESKTATMWKEQGKQKSRHPNEPNDKDQINSHNHGKRLGKAFSFNLKERRVHHNNHPKHNKEDGSTDGDGDPLKGSIFDVTGPQPGGHHRRNSSSDISGDQDGERWRVEAEGECTSRKKVALLRRFGDLIGRRSYSDR